MKTPVLLIGNFLSAAGGSRGVCEELALRLQKSGTHVITASGKPARLARLFDMLRTTICKRHDYVVAQIDVYSGPAFLWAEMVCAALRRLNKPYVLTLHGGNLPAFSQKNPKRVGRLLASASVVTTPSRFLLEGMSVYRSDLRLLPNAIDLDRYPFKLRTKAHPNLVWLRTFHEIYNPTLAPRVIHLLVQRSPSVCLTMVGPDKQDGSFARTKTIAKELNVEKQICFPGGVSKNEVPRWLAQGDIFLNTTNVDNTPVSVLEAMACGLCITSTDVGGLPHLLSHGRNALLVPPNDPEAMASAVGRLLNEPVLAARLSRNARIKAAEHDWSEILPQWEKLFDSISRTAPCAPFKSKITAE